MKPGSLVECIDNSHMQSVKLETPYTVSRILKKFDVFGAVLGQLLVITADAIFLEEVSDYINIGPVVIEQPYAMAKFRELLPPIANIEEHINSEVLETELV